MDKRWLDFLNLCKITDDDLNDGIVNEVIAHEKEKEIEIQVTFPSPKPVALLKKLIQASEKNVCDRELICRIKFHFNYENIEITNNILTDYYLQSIKDCSQYNNMVSILECYNYQIEYPKINILVATPEEEKNIQLVLPNINKFFTDYALKEVSIETEINPFEISVIEKYRQKKEIEKKQYQTEKREREIQKQRYMEQNQTEFRASKRAVTAGIFKISDLPITSLEVIEFKQARGTDKVIVKGVVKQPETRTIISKKTNTTYFLFSCLLTDYEDTIAVKRFFRPADEKFFKEQLKENLEIEISGNVQYDDFAKDVIIMADKIVILGSDTIQLRFDEAEVKRVELHTHTKMSIQDSCVDVDKYVKLAKSFGHKALAVTDHNNCHILPEFFKECKKYGLKPIAGLEGSFIDENRYKIALTNHKIDLNEATFVVFDIETTGLRNNYDDIIEIGAVKLVKGMAVDNFLTFVKPNKKINEVIENITHISNDDVAKAPGVKETLQSFIDFVGDAILVAHNATFDLDFIQHKIKVNKLKAPNFPCIDTMQLARILYGGKLKQFSLEKVAKFLKVNVETQHRALSDSITTSNAFKVMLGDLQEKLILNYQNINDLIDEKEAFKYVYPKHITLLVRNKVGLKNLYKIISDSQTTHFYREPRILKKVLDAHREGLLVGTSCSNGEIFRLAYEKSYEDVIKAIEYYDYVEIQPLECYRYLVDLSGEEETSEYIKDAILKIIQAAKVKNKIIVATGDVHHLSKEDVSLREIYVNVPLPGGGLHSLCDTKIKHIPNMSFLTTTEMLKEMNFLSIEDAYEYVVTNTNKIADMIEEFSLFPKELFVPRDNFLEKYNIPSMSEGVRKLSYDTAYSIYGNPLPKYVEDRLELELTSIINNGFASVYYISHLLVKKSNDAGYIVGSRGSVGSSFVATMMGITEVNPLKPHYVCPNCHFSAFKYDSIEAEKYQNLDVPEILSELHNADVGLDLKKKNCPHCNTLLKNDGIDIAFQTFLGFKGDKVPDIDLNFSGEYQETAHLFCREMFGIDNSFRAGTVTSVANKTAYGFVKGFLERKNQNKRQAEINRIAESITGAKKTTGQHPGGIVVVPDHIEYTDITPVQYPADDTEAVWRTTHYDYHSFESNLLKLDILGHDDPTVLKTLIDYVHQNSDEFPFNNVEDIPFVDDKVLSLFSTKAALNLTADDGDRLSSATVGIPEFGTNFVREMLETIKPKSYSDIIKISGLAHGTGVWLGNASALVTGADKNYNGRLPFKEVIGCRDDIMIYLIDKNLPAFDAFSIMESVRKGKGLTAENEKLMRAHNVPNWYIESCKKIQYMFPKAHATAYVIMALRIGWFKVYRPIYYYAVYFSKRAKAFHVEAFVNGKNAIKNLINEIENKEDRKNKEVDLLDELKIALEMVLRGFTFKQININISSATDFVISDDKKSLYLPFSSLDALGEGAAKTVVEARNVMPFTSIEDVVKRTKLNKTQMAKLKVLGAFGNLPEKEVNALF